MNRCLLIPTVIFLLVVHTSTAQIEKGGKFVGGSISINLDDNESERLTPDPKQQNESESSNYSLGLHPYMGFFIRDRLALGSELSLSFGNQTHQSNTSDQEALRNSSSIGVGLTVFLKKMNPINGFLKDHQENRFGWYIRSELGGRYHRNDQETKITYIDSTGQEFRSHLQESIIFHLSGTGGLYYFIGERWSIEMDLLWLSLSYHQQQNSSFGTADIRSQSLRLNSSFSNQFSITQAFTVNYYF